MRRWSWMAGAVVLVLVGFALGVFLRGPLFGGVDWCRDIDYGNLPQWLAMLIGGVVAGFTIYGILTARRS